MSTLTEAVAKADAEPESNADPEAGDDSPQRKTTTTLTGINLEALRRDAVHIDWSVVIDADRIDVKVQEFQRLIFQLYDAHAPIKKIRLRHAPAPWITQDIRDAMLKRDSAKRRYNKCSSDINLGRYKYWRNFCSRLCRDARRRHIHNSIVGSSPAKTWSFLRSLGIGKTSNSFSGSVDLNALNVHFSSVPVTLDASVKARTLGHLNDQPRPLCSSFQLTTVAEEDVKKHILAITSTAVGNDDISSRMISLLLPQLLPILCHIFNYSLVNSCFPSAWKRANIIPLPKVSNPTSFSNFRPISLLPYLSKVLEHIVHNQLSSYLTSNSLLSPFQSGFRSGHSTVTALLKVTDDIRLAMEDKSLTILTLLDFSSAFNSVDFDVLLAILRSLNVSPLALAWFESYLRGRSQRIHSDDVSSDWCDLGAGVPQGGVLNILFDVSEIIVYKATGIVFTIIDVNCFNEAGVMDL
ncbi:uncharacterized protein [Battus philenor]|uniref:uncharacterized protein n=1 Tax=Battus philenor TaxID=42288 RepID=UPI0035CF920F